MYRCLLFLAAVLPAGAQSVLYVCGNSTENYVVGSKLPPSGVFKRSPDGKWTHIGYPLPFIFSFTGDPARKDGLLLAAGNGLLRTAGAGLDWTQLTGSDVTELRDVDTDPNAPGTICFGHTAGIRITHDNAKTWREIGGPLRRKFTEAIRFDPKRPRVLLAGNEQGIFRTEDEGGSWRLAGASGLQVLRIAGSPHDPCFWVAATQAGGLFASSDCGVTFENLGAVGFGRNVYDVSFDPSVPGRIAVAGWGPGIVVSGDNGKTWTPRNAGLPRTDATGVAFDPSHPGRLFAAIHDDAVYVSDDAGVTWRKDGLANSHVNRMRFVPEVVK